MLNDEFRTAGRPPDRDGLVVAVALAGVIRRADQHRCGVDDTCRCSSTDHLHLVPYHHVAQAGASYPSPRYTVDPETLTVTVAPLAVVSMKPPALTVATVPVTLA